MTVSSASLVLPSTPSSVVLTVSFNSSSPRSSRSQLSAVGPVLSVEAGHPAIVLAASRWNVALHAAAESVTARFHQEAGATSGA